MPDYLRKNYDNADRWHSYYRQVREVMEFEPESVLEVGKGSGLVSTVLKSRGYALQSLDIDPSLNPDILGSVLEIPAGDAVFDIVLCAEVLEHLPFEEFPKALSEIRRVAKKGVVLSLPHWGWVFHLRMKVPLLPRLDLFGKLSGLKTHPPGGEHFWEIGKKGYPLSRVKSEIEKAGFLVRRCYMDADAPYHRFFILDKR